MCLSMLSIKLTSPEKEKTFSGEEPAEWPIYPNQVILEVSADSLS